MAAHTYPSSGGGWTTCSRLLADRCVLCGSNPGENGMGLRALDDLGFRCVCKAGRAGPSHMGGGLLAPPDCERPCHAGRAAPPSLRGRGAVSPARWLRPPVMGAKPDGQPLPCGWGAVSPAGWSQCLLGLLEWADNPIVDARAKLDGLPPLRSWRGGRQPRQVALSLGFGSPCWAGCPPLGGGGLPRHSIRVVVPFHLSARPDGLLPPTRVGGCKPRRIANARAKLDGQPSFLAWKGGRQPRQVALSCGGVALRRRPPFLRRGGLFVRAGLLGKIGLFSSSPSPSRPPSPLLSSRLPPLSWGAACCSASPACSPDPPGSGAVLANLNLA